jgi:Predicted integral membrane protein (DUF2269)
MLILKFLHILGMFTAVTALFSHELVFFRAAGARDVPAMRRIGSLTPAVETFGVVTFFVSVGLGLAAAVVGGFDLTAPWLIIAYVIVAVLVVLGAGIESPYLKRMHRAAEESPVEKPSEELEALIRAPRRWASWWISTLLYVAVIFDMVVKPFG